MKNEGQNVNLSRIINCIVVLDMQVKCRVILLTVFATSVYVYVEHKCHVNIVSH